MNDDMRELSLGAKLGITPSFDLPIGYDARLGKVAQIGKRANTHTLVNEVKGQSPLSKCNRHRKFITEVTYPFSILICLCL